MALDDCKLVRLPRARDERGSLTFIESHRHVPFAMQRVYYLYDVPVGESRGGHAHRALYQLLIALSGSVRIELDDGATRRVFTLDSPDQGLLVVPMIWRDLSEFSAGAVCMVLASEPYDAADYIHDHDAFVEEACA
jgi:hypothetical protein